jgi:hypothetical protein
VFTPSFKRVAVFEARNAAAAVLVTEVIFVFCVALIPSILFAEAKAALAALNAAVTNGLEAAAELMYVFAALVKLFAPIEFNPSFGPVTSPSVILLFPILCVAIFVFLFLL